MLMHGFETRATGVQIGQLSQEASREGAEAQLRPVTYKERSESADWQAPLILSGQSLNPQFGIERYT